MKESTVRQYFDEVRGWEGDEGAEKYKGWDAGKLRDVYRDGQVLT